MQKKFWAIAALLVFVAALAAYLFLGPRGEPEPPPVALQIAPLAPAAVPPPPAPPVAVAPVEPAILHPLPETATATPLADTGKGDALLLKALATALDKQWLALIVPDELIRRIVTTVDNLPRQHLPAALVPIKRVPGAFMVSGTDDSIAVDARNAARYTPYVRLIMAVDASPLDAVYRLFYPYLQRAFRELGYPGAYFNDRLVVAIDDLLAAPEPLEPIRLIQPRVLYEFADVKLSERSAGQKIMMRMGHDNAELLKAKLREIRQLVAAAPDPLSPHRR